MSKRSSDRVSALLEGQSIDRVPVFPFTLGFCARNVGYPIASIYSDAHKSFQAQLWTQEMYGYDGWPQYGYASYGAWEFGAEIRFPTGDWEQAPAYERPPVQSEGEVETLKLPDVKTTGMIPLAMEFSKMQKESGLPVTITLAGVFTIGANMCAIDKLCRWLIKNPPVVHKVLRLATEHISNVVQYWADTFGVEDTLVWIWEPSADNNIISPRQFKEFIVPYQKEAHEKILATGIKHIICHICGEQNLNLPYWAEVPFGDPGIVSFGHQVDLTTAIKFFGDTCIVAGNIDPQIIQTGTPEQVYEISQQCIEKAKHSPRGYILMSGCEVPPLSPPHNLYMIVKAVNDSGWYKRE